MGRIFKFIIKRNFYDLKWIEKYKFLDHPNQKIKFSIKGGELLKKNAPFLYLWVQFCSLDTSRSCLSLRNPETWRSRILLLANFSNKHLEIHFIVSRGIVILNTKGSFYRTQQLEGHWGRLDLLVIFPNTLMVWVWADFFSATSTALWNFELLARVF